MREQPEHSLLLKWLILTGLILFSVVTAWNEGIISLLYDVDTVSYTHLRAHET